MIRLDDNAFTMVVFLDTHAQRTWIILNLLIPPSQPCLELDELFSKNTHLHNFIPLKINLEVFSGIRRNMSSSIVTHRIGNITKISTTTTTATHLGHDALMMIMTTMTPPMRQQQWIMRVQRWTRDVAYVDRALPTNLATLCTDHRYVPNSTFSFFF